MKIEIVEREIRLPDCKPVLSYAEATTDDWLNMRGTFLGGSDAAAACDMDKYRSRFVLCAEKTNRVSGFEGNELTEMGTLIEPFIRREVVPDYLAKQGIDAEVIDPTHTYQSTRWPWMGVNVDGFIITDGQTVGLEIKNNSAYRLKEYGGIFGNELPDAYYVQNQHAMAVTGLSAWWHFALIGGSRVAWRTIPRNDEFIEWMVEQERSIWEILQLDDPLLFPLPGGTDADMGALMEMGSPQLDGVVDLSEVGGLIERYGSIGEVISTSTAERESVKQQIIYHLGQYRTGETDRYKVAFSLSERRSVDIDRLRRDHRETVDQYTTWAESGRLSVKRRKV